jgi:molybdopterin synthase catalytic subunit
MRVRVLFFGRLREIVGIAQEDIELAEGARLEDLFVRYWNVHPQLAEFRHSVAPAVNQVLAGWESRLAQGDEVAFLPPVSGGGVEAVQQPEIVELVRSTIGVAGVVTQVVKPEYGAVVTFEGVVRNHFRGRRTAYLEYEAYEPMALAALRQIAGEMRRLSGSGSVALVHRLGRVAIGETSVVVCVASAHRGSAFDACRYGIDALKRTVPIWKKEFLEDGAVWATGERLVHSNVLPAKT